MSDDLSVSGFFEFFDGPAVEEVELEQPQQQALTPKEKQTLNHMFMHCEHKYLMLPLRCTWKEKVLAVLHVVRRREFTQFDPKIGHCVLTRFCDYNMAYFDLDKESQVVHETLFRDVRGRQLDNSVNIISIKVAESDVRYPISIYGTVLARDQNDYKCVYLFKRGRDDPQLITRKNRMLALTGPYRALGDDLDYMYFEFNLKIKGEGEIDEDFSKGLVTRCAYRNTPGIPSTYSLESYLSTVDIVCVRVRHALEASIRVNFFNGKTTFTGKIFASTSASSTSKMALYDSQVAGTKTEFGSGGSVSLSRHVVAVPRGEDLLLYFCARDSYNKSRRLKFVIGNGVDERVCDLGTYKLQLKIIWKCVFRHQRRHGLW
ncbi:unnamed protein product [Urochloa decumbens]|uniref:DUF6598 domain-containing protein n=1 Tax=Urochloa decumbens TaxID=240449 RepID=A0ABC8YY58_9POAL